MPLLQKPRNPNYGLKKKRDPGKWRKTSFSVLRETVDYLDARRATIPIRKLIDEAVKLYRECRHELKPTTGTGGRRLSINTTASPDTLAYVEFMRSAMTPGELVDEAIRLYRQLNPDEEDVA